MVANEAFFQIWLSLVLMQEMEMTRTKDEWRPGLPKFSKPKLNKKNHVAMQNGVEHFKSNWSASLPHNTSYRGGSPTKNQNLQSRLNGLLTLSQ